MVKHKKNMDEKVDRPVNLKKIAETSKIEQSLLPTNDMTLWDKALAKKMDVFAQVFPLGNDAQPPPRSGKQSRNMNILLWNLSVTVNR